MVHLLHEVARRLLVLVLVEQEQVPMRARQLIG
jgi:hypothetical protein